jgi:hypothetical protein
MKYRSEESIKGLYVIGIIITVIVIFGFMIYFP